MTAVDRLGALGTLLACTVCRGELSMTADDIACAGCRTSYRVGPRFIDLVPDTGARPTLGMLFLQDPLHISRLEHVTRPAFVDLMGANWDREVGPSQEEAYLREWVRPVSGPVLDLACGTGRLTGALVSRFGADRVIGLDYSPAMLDEAAARGDDVVLLRGDAVRLPFADNVLGAVNCWQALQVFGDPLGAFREVARCLRPHGTFTLGTFATAEPPLQRYFQRRHEEAFRIRSFTVEQLRSWLAAVGMPVEHVWQHNTLIFMTARRAAP